jgi:zinc/manganese transport system substrate-binding protein
MLHRLLSPVRVGIIGLALLLSLSVASCTGTSSNTGGGVLSVVAGENFWGSIATQLGGVHASVTTIVSDPNADPHHYESNNSDARAFAAAQYVILNGTGYDDWGQQLLAAKPVSGRKVLTVATLLGKRQGDNPYFWYNPDYVEQVANQITKDYQSLDPKDSAYFTQQRTAFEDALATYHRLLGEIKAKFAGQKVGSTESIFVYMANYLGLNLISPPDFMEAVAEGNDPPAGCVLTFEQQILQRQIGVLVYNAHTLTQVTDHLKGLAVAHGIPLVAVTATIQPPDVRFQDWQVEQLLELQIALNLNAQALGH